MLLYLYVFDIAQSAIIRLLLLAFIYLISKKREYISFCVCIIISLTIGVLSLSVSNQPGVVTKIHPSFTIVKQGTSNIMMWSTYEGSVDDKVKLSGMLVEAEKSTYNAVNRISYVVNKGSIETVKSGKSIKSKLWNRFKSVDYVRKFLFNETIEDLPMLTSLSLQVSGSLAILLTLFDRYIDDKRERIICIFYFIIYGFILGFGFSLLRLILTKVLGKEKSGISLLILYPGSALSFHFLFPFFKDILTGISVHFRSISFKVLVPFLSLISSYRFSIVEFFLYPIFKLISGYLFWIVLLVPMGSQFVEWMIGTLIQMMSYNLLSFFEVVGKPSILLLVVALLLYTTRFKQWSYTVLFLSLFLMVYPLRAQVVYLDVGQGDASLIQSPLNAYTTLIDTGKRNQYENLKRKLHSYGVSKIDQIIITHDDEDHSGSLDLLQKDFKVGKVVRDYTDIEGLTPLNLNRDYEDTNANSLLFAGRMKDTTMLFTGDAGVVQEMEMMRVFPGLEVDVLKLGHHGSKTSSHPSFIKQLKPKYAIASSNPKIYGHPHIDVKKNLFKSRVILLETAKEGDIRFIFTILFDFIHTEYRGFAII